MGVDAAHPQQTAEHEERRAQRLEGQRRELNVKEQRDQRCQDYCRHSWSTRRRDPRDGPQKCGHCEACQGLGAAVSITMVLEKHDERRQEQQRWPEYRPQARARTRV